MRVARTRGLEPVHRRGAILALALAAAASPGLLTTAPAAAAATDAGREAAYTFAFQDAEISQVAAEVLGSLGLTFSVDPSVSGRISFRIDQRLTRAQLLQAFEAALAANNVVLVRQGDVLLLTARNKAKTAAAVRPAAEGRSRGGYEVVAAPVSFALPTEVAKALEAITGPGVVLSANDRLGLIVLAGSGPQLQSALESLKVFDQSGLEGSRIRWFELSQAPAAQVASELESLLKAAGVSSVRVAPLKRLNGLILFGSSNVALDQASNWVPRLDVPTKDTAASLWVYNPRNTSAEALARTLNAISSTQTQVEQTGLSERSPSPRSAASSPSSPEIASTLSASAPVEEAVRAAVDKDTNTLLVSAPAWQWVQLQRVLAQIDRPQAQVLIEATVLEVTLRNEFRLGVDWSVMAASGRLQVSSVGSETGAIGPTYPGFSVTFLDSDVQAAISALGARTNVEVVSAPKIVTLDNRTAHLLVGDQVPVVTQTSRSTTTGDAPLVSNIDYRNSGVILTVTPRISGDDRVVLDVAQEVSSVVKTLTSGIDSPTIQQRKLESALMLSDGGVVALGGLISRSRDTGNSGIPGLKDIPGVGHLFKSSTRNVARTELIVLMKAKILRDAAGTDAAMTALLADLREVQARGLLHGP